MMLSGRVRLPHYGGRRMISHGFSFAIVFSLISMTLMQITKSSAPQPSVPPFPSCALSRVKNTGRSCRLAVAYPRLTHLRILEFA